MTECQIFGRFTSSMFYHNNLWAAIDWEWDITVFSGSRNLHIYFGQDKAKWWRTGWIMFGLICNVQHFFSPLHCSRHFCQRCSLYEDKRDMHQSREYRVHRVTVQLQQVVQEQFPSLLDSMRSFWHYFIFWLKCFLFRVFFFFCSRAPPPLLSLGTSLGEEF